MTFSGYSIPWENISQYLEWVNAPNDPYKLRTRPFQKYDVRLWNFELETNAEVLPPFWETVGCFMKDLKIFQCQFYGKTELKRILFELTPNMEKLELDQNSYQKSRAEWRQLSEEERGLEPPKRGEESSRNLNMKELIVSLQQEIVYNLPEWPEYENYTYSRNHDDYLPITWTSIFKTFPNLKNLELKGIDPDPKQYLRENEYSGMNTVLNVICRQNRRTATGLKLQRLNIVGAQTNALNFFPRSTLNHLQKLQFPLTILDLDIGVSTFSSDFKKILELYGKTLKTLKVYRAEYAEPFTHFPFGVLLESMTELQLQGPIVPNLLFLKEFPNLKILRLLNDDHELSHCKRYRADSRHSYDDSDYDGPTRCIERTKFSKLENFSLPNLVEFVNGDEICTGGQMRSLSKLMPKLERLRIGVNNDGFKILCERWNNTLLELDMTPSKVDDRVLIGDGDLQLANLSDLKHLRRLTINWIQSDDVVYKGLLALPHLTKVNLSCYKHRSVMKPLQHSHPSSAALEVSFVTRSDNNR